MITRRCPYSLKDRVLVFGTSDGGSIPPRGTYHADGSVAQLVEQLPLKELVVGSSPTGFTKSNGRAVPTSVGVGCEFDSRRTHQTIVENLHLFI